MDGQEGGFVLRVCGGSRMYVARELGQVQHSREDRKSRNKNKKRIAAHHLISTLVHAWAF